MRDESGTEGPRSPSGGRSWKRRAAGLEADLARARAALAEAERELRFTRQMIDSAPIAIGVLEGPEQVVSRVNPATLRITGLSREELIGKPIARLLPELYPRFGPVLERVYRNGQSEQKQDLAVSLPNGQTIYVDVTCAPLPGPTGDTIGVVFLAIDVTARHLAREERARLLTRQRALAQIAQALVHEMGLSQVVDVIAEQSLQVLRVDTVALWLADAARRELALLAQRNLTARTVEATRRLSFDAPYLASKAARTGEVQVVEDFAAPSARSTGADLAEEEGLQSILVAPLVTRGKLVGVMSHGSRTLRRFTPQDLAFNATVADLFAVAIEHAQLYDRVRQELQLREEFMASAAHELKTPVTVIKGRAQLQLRTGTSEPGVRRTLETIIQHADRINRLAEDLLAVDRFRLGRAVLQRERFDLGTMVREQVAVLARTLADYRFQVDTSEPLLVDADRSLIAEVLANLLEVATLYSPLGGSIEVMARRVEASAVVSVTDHGIGVVPERQPHVFEAFYELVPPGQPGYVGVTHVGLYLSKQIIEAHGGRIWLTSEPGVGSTFTFSIPSAQSPAVPPGLT